MIMDGIGIDKFCKVYHRCFPFLFVTDCVFTGNTISFAVARFRPMRPVILIAQKGKNMNAAKSGETKDEYFPFY